MSTPPPLTAEPPSLPKHSGPPTIVSSLDLDSLEPGTRHNLHLDLFRDPAGQQLRIPVLVVKGAEPGPVLGITAAIHGNELNGIPAVHRFVHGLDPKRLRGTVVGISVVNIPGFLLRRRGFSDARDLNRLFPGKTGGTDSQLVIMRLREQFLTHVNYLVDLHTAGPGRTNPVYARVDLEDPASVELGIAARPDLIVNKPASPKTLRGAARALGIPCVTLELGAPQVLQPEIVLRATKGLRRIARHLEMLSRPLGLGGRPPLCNESSWVYSEHGGLLEVFPDLLARVRKGQPIAHIVNLFGEIVGEYKAPFKAIVIGKTADPVAPIGTRIVHLGKLVPWDE
ncbi:succinylglutamate desuccinylase/aspartoacylase family protein [Enhygromyxa salina]|uniref:succinylglutamate desuccinylase/aspartoacylase family protein n=1 Tax=Enhygromyxa salina TaxID=215803 RepID=UPI0015E7BCD1|nr:succinylglutamate desuccinylase/aspartoacylase family protein [Enhygromyxa salina]